ncbi:hypothetical protein LSH36_611g02045 [Paralvinella palmiformis]|uniref:Uncharacterized protein n=1 Tax=Paralvinella palmiformis TaxID=53620 RepID=A0AAD9J4Q4_9ANNE|nr:hypothetical protein LSH36_611g02045 [Paralvinella palmiformis]
MADSEDSAAPSGIVSAIRDNLEQAFADDVPQSRSGSQDDLDMPHQEALKSALSALNAQSVDDLAKRGMWTRDTILDSAKFHNPLHYLVECYVSAVETGGAANLLQSFSECLSVILDHDVDINEGDINRNTPLHLVCHHCGDEPVIRKLTASGSKVNLENVNNQTPLHLATDNGTSGDVEALLTAGADPNKLDCIGYGPLHIAVKYRRNRDIIKCLVACGADVDLQSQDARGRGSAPLHTAIRHDRKENVKLLLELGASSDVIDSSGQTALLLAAKYDITGDMITYLLQSGAHIDATDTIYEETALHKAIKRNMIENIKVLIGKGASLSQPDVNGDTPLHTAATLCQNIETWVALMSGNKPDIRRRNAKKQTVLDRASRASNKLAVNILKQMAE